MLWMVSPGAVAALATVSSSSLLTPARSRSAKVVGRPTLSMPSPDSSVLASTTFSRAGVTTCCWAAWRAEKP
jgi:hypothetical protein